MDNTIASAVTAPNLEVISTFWDDRFLFDWRSVSQHSHLHFYLQTIKDTFDLYDANHDGKITRDELKSVFEKMGKEPTEEALNAWMESVDQNGTVKRSLKIFSSRDTFTMVQFPAPLLLENPTDVRRKPVVPMVMSSLGGKILKQGCYFGPKEILDINIWYFL